MNVGAETETDYGDYFMWGSTTPNTDTICNWSTCPFNNESSSYDSGYFDSVKDDVCPNGILAKEYDAASQIMGGDWRMPTMDELLELYNNTTSKWVANYNGSGVNGWKFTASNGNSIFIPAEGYRSGSSSGGQGSSGRVWSSSLYTEYNYAWSFGFYSGELLADYGKQSRYYGLSVRGVL